MSCSWLTHKFFQIFSWNTIFEVVLFSFQRSNKKADKDSSQDIACLNKLCVQVDLKTWFRTHGVIPHKDQPSTTVTTPTSTTTTTSISSIANTSIGRPSIVIGPGGTTASAKQGPSVHHPHQIVLTHQQLSQSPPPPPPHNNSMQPLGQSLTTPESDREFSSQVASPNMGGEKMDENKSTFASP